MNMEGIWCEFQTPLKRFISLRVRDQSKVDDILQMVFMKIYEHITDLKEKQNLQSWIYQITRNTIIDYYRSIKPAEKLPSDFEISDTTTEEKNFTQEVVACLESTIQVLPEKYREALLLSEIQGLSQKELSKKLNIPYSTAKSRVQRGREELKKLLMGCCHIESDKYGNIIDFYIKFKY